MHCLILNIKKNIDPPFPGTQETQAHPVTSSYYLGIIITIIIEQDHLQEVHRERVEQPTTLAQLSTSGDVKELRDQARDTALGTCQFGHISCVGSESPSMESNSDHFCRLALELGNRPKLHLVPITEQRWSGNPSLCAL